jgi:hypothetical protein
VTKHIIDAADIGVSDLPGEQHLAAKALRRLLVSGNLRQQCFERNGFVQFQVFCLIDLTHATVAQGARDAKAVREDSAGFK